MAWRPYAANIHCIHPPTALEQASLSRLHGKSLLKCLDTRLLLRMCAPVWRGVVQTFSALLARLVSKRLPPQHPIQRFLVARLLHMGIISLHEAAKTGNLALIGKAMAAGMDINAPDKLKRVPLHLAAWSGQTVCSYVHYTCSRLATVLPLEVYMFQQADWTTSPSGPVLDCVVSVELLTILEALHVGSWS